MGEADIARMTSAEGEGTSELLFCTTEEGVRRALGQSAGKVLLLSDGELALAAYASPRTVQVVFDGDALPLFSMPDGVSRVLAAGGRETLLAARYFAEVRSVPCVLLPSHASLDGVYERNGDLLLGGKRLRVPLKQGETVCDLSRMKPTLADAYARILLVRLAKIETDALNALKGSALFAGNADGEPQTAEELLEESAALRRAEAEGAYAGEGVVLARLLGGGGAWGAVLLLSALYAAFFAKGKPRRYFTPDYRARAKQAGIAYTGAGIPTMEEYVTRAMRLERIRAEFTARALAFLDEREKQYAVLCRFAERRPPLRCGRTDLMRSLPEHAPCGLAAVIRDFGLMDWSDDEGRIIARG